MTGSKEQNGTASESNKQNESASGPAGQRQPVGFSAWSLGVRGQALSWHTSVNDRGEYVRKQSVFRKWVTADGSSGFKAEKGRYHVYVSLACPWASRVLLVRRVKGLEDAIDVTVVDWLLQEGGWRFTDQRSRCRLDPINHASYLREIYKSSDPEYQGNITVPVLFDTATKTIVNNESSEIIRMLNSEFNAFCPSPAHAALHLYPESLRSTIDEINDWVYTNINNGVYRCGFARSQEAYEAAFDALFHHLNKAEDILSRQRYLTGERFTEADVRLFVTLIRFDAVYVLHFKTNLKRIADYPNLQNYTKEIYQMPGVRDTVDFEHIKHHYMESHRNINPLGIVAKGPLLDFDSPHDRARLPGKPLYDAA